jgi:hypothetical protein
MGWTTLIADIIHFLMGFAIAAGVRGRVFGVLFAWLNAPGQLALLPAYPFLGRPSSWMCCSSTP